MLAIFDFRFSIFDFRFVPVRRPGVVAGELAPEED